MDKIKKKTNRVVASKDGGESMTLSEMRERKRELGYSYEQIAEWSGVPLSTVQKVLTGATKSPRYETLLAIEGVLEDSFPDRVGEIAYAYGEHIVKRQGQYTIEDYYNWPEDERIELIDGFIYHLSMPSIRHQKIVGEIDFAFKSFVKMKKGKCEIFGAGVDVCLDSDNKTMIVPDITVVCHRDKFTEKYVDGAPDMVVEVLSKSTKKKDMTIKLEKYATAGVREYWIVNPDKETVLVYKFNGEDETDAEIFFYTFANQVPVGIWNDECVVDFAEIKEGLMELTSRSE